MAAEQRGIEDGRTAGAQFDHKRAGLRVLHGGVERGRSGSDRRDGGIGVGPTGGAPGLPPIAGNFEAVGRDRGGIKSADVGIGRHGGGRGYSKRRSQRRPGQPGVVAARARAGVDGGGVGGRVHHQARWAGSRAQGLPACRAIHTAENLCRLTAGERTDRSVDRVGVDCPLGVRVHGN